MSVERLEVVLQQFNTKIKAMASQNSNILLNNMEIMKSIKNPQILNSMHKFNKNYVSMSESQDK